MDLSAGAHFRGKPGKLTLDRGYLRDFEALFGAPAHA
jgi:hypothetical protein